MQVSELAISRQKAYCITTCNDTILRLVHLHEINILAERENCVCMSPYADFFEN